MKLESSCLYSEYLTVETLPSYQVSLLRVTFHDAPCLEFVVRIQEVSNKNFLYKQYNSEGKPRVGNTLLCETWFLLPEALAAWVVGVQKPVVKAPMTQAMTETNQTQRVAHRHESD